MLLLVADYNGRTALKQQLKEAISILSRSCLQQEPMSMLLLLVFMDGLHSKSS